MKKRTVFIAIACMLCSLLFFTACGKHAVQDKKYVKIEMKTGDVLEELFLSSEDIESFVNMTPVPQVTPEGF